MGGSGVPVTAATRALRAAGATFTGHRYTYRERGGTRAAAAALGVDEHAVVKTIVMTADGAPLLVLMHGDREVSTRAVGRHLGARRVAIATPSDARRVTGYEVGGISPFGIRRRLRVLVQPSVLALPRVLVNGGLRGFLVEVDPVLLVRIAGAEAAEVAAS